MALKKQHFVDGEMPIFDRACIHKRGEYSQSRMWLPKENKYARKSLLTRSEASLQRLMNKSNSLLTKATSQYSINGLLMKMAINARLRLLNVLSAGGLPVLMER